MDIKVKLNKNMKEYVEKIREKAEKIREKALSENRTEYENALWQIVKNLEYIDGGIYVNR